MAHDRVFQVIPHAVDYFTGKALEFDFDKEEEDYDLELVVERTFKDFS